MPRPISNTVYPCRVSESAFAALENLASRTDAFLLCIREDLAEALRIAGDTDVSGELAYLRETITEHLREQLPEAFAASAEQFDADPFKGGRPMSTFTLDRSGRVECAASFQPIGWAIWEDLSPFAQGYVEAMLASSEMARLIQGDEVDGLYWVPRFSDLDPSALALILRDCERLRGEDTKEQGASCWWLRNHPIGLFQEVYPDLPPLHPYVSEEGRVCLRPVDADPFKRGV